MKTSIALALFSGNVKFMAKTLGCSVQAIHQFGEELPPLRAYQMKELWPKELKGVSVEREKDILKRSLKQQT